VVGDAEALGLYLLPEARDLPVNLLAFVRNPDVANIFGEHDVILLIERRQFTLAAKHAAREARGYRV
jgi:hypothetical protein